MFRNLWKDDAGVVSLEYLLLSVVVGLGMAVGTAAVSDALNAEYVELGQAILTLDTGYSINPQASFGATTFAIGAKGGTLAFDTPGVERDQAYGQLPSFLGTGIAGATP